MWRLLKEYGASECFERVLRWRICHQPGHPRDRYWSLSVFLLSFKTSWVPPTGIVNIAILIAGLIYLLGPVLSESMATREKEIQQDWMQLARAAGRLQIQSVKLATTGLDWQPIWS
eukprot:5936853-Amphidinium_carterae.1